MTHDASRSTTPRRAPRSDDRHARILHRPCPPVTLPLVGADRLARWAPAAAVTYVALFVAAYLLTAKGPCGTGCFARTTDERVVAFYEDSGNRWRVGIAYLLLGVALAAFLWFLARLHAAVTEIDGGRDMLARLVLLGGGVYAALEAAGIAAYAAVATGPGLVTDEEHYRVDAAVVRAAGDVSWMLRSLGTVAAATLALAAALAVRRAGRPGLSRAARGNRRRFPRTPDGRDRLARRRVPSPAPRLALK